MPAVNNGRHVKKQLFLICLLYATTGFMPLIKLPELRQYHNGIKEQALQIYKASDICLGLLLYIKFNSTFFRQILDWDTILT